MRDSVGWAGNAIAFPFFVGLLPLVPFTQGSLPWQLAGIVNKDLSPLALRPRVSTSVPLADWKEKYFL